jgi:hypothetical protein
LPASARASTAAGDHASRQHEVVTADEAEPSAVLAVIWCRLGIDNRSRI